MDNTSNSIKHKAIANGASKNTNRANNDLLGWVVYLVPAMIITMFMIINSTEITSYIPIELLLIISNTYDVDKLLAI
jgi:TRAP-type mannitol/chloroaromatic compound transport system permease small subunit